MADVSPKDFEKQNEKVVAGVIDRSPIRRIFHSYKGQKDYDARGVDVSAPRFNSKYAKELAVAEEKMKDRAASWKEKFRMNFWYDYDNDPNYERWKYEMAETKEALHLHWIDETLDNLDCLLRFGFRVCTTVGIFYGVGRTAYLWQTIDRGYAKLHGVSLTSIATWEIPVGVVGGFGVGACFAVGCLLGDITARLASCAYENTMSRPRRQWYNVLAAGFCGSVCTSASTSFLFRNYLNFRGHFVLNSSLVVGGTAIASYLAVMVYKPWVRMYPASPDDPPMIPWNKRSLRGSSEGTAATRGRYI